MCRHLRFHSESDGLHYGNSGRDAALWQRMNSSDLPAQMEVKLSEVLALAGGGKQWKNNFQRVYPLQQSEGSNKWTLRDVRVGLVGQEEAEMLQETTVLVELGLNVLFI